MRGKDRERHNATSGLGTDARTLSTARITETSRIPIRKRSCRRCATSMRSNAVPPSSPSFRKTFEDVTIPSASNEPCGWLRGHNRVPRKRRRPTSRRRRPSVSLNLPVDGSCPCAIGRQGEPVAGELDPAALMPDTLEHAAQRGDQAGVLVRDDQPHPGFGRPPSSPGRQLMAQIVHGSECTRPRRCWWGPARVPGTRPARRSATWCPVSPVRESKLRGRVGRNGREGRRNPEDPGRFSVGVRLRGVGDLLKLAAERQQIYHRRVAGQAAPWTTDPILGRFRFTNAYRAADRVSQDLIRIMYEGSQLAEDVVLRTLLYRFFNKPSTWYALEGHAARCAGRTSTSISTREPSTLCSTGVSGTTPRPTSASPPFGAARQHRSHLLLVEH